jgi:hypothetical protein
MPTQGPSLLRQISPITQRRPVAKLPRLSFAKLLRGEKDESDALFEACRATGFFMLDFEGCPKGETFLEKAEDMFDLNQEVNNVDIKGLMEYSCQLPSLLR